MTTAANARLTETERERIILEHMPQVRLIARRIHERVPGNISLEDLISTGIVGADLRDRPVRSDPGSQAEDLCRVQDSRRHPRQLAADGLGSSSAAQARSPDRIGRNSVGAGPSP